VSPVSFKMAAMTDTGRKRKRNEDSVRVNSEHGFAVLADGMGGHQAGDVASQMAVELICEEFSGKFSDNGNEYVLTEADLSGAISNANSAIHLSSHENPDNQGMGSTVVVFALNGDQMLCAHVGDSRLYLVRESTIRQVTTDHTLAQHYVEMGVMSSSEAAAWHGRNMLMRGLGIEKDTSADVNQVSLEAGDILVACSDGLTDVLTDDEILHIATTPATTEATANKLISAANRGGGPDNITVVVVLVTNAPPR